MVSISSVAMAIRQMEDEEKIFLTLERYATTKTGKAFARGKANAFRQAYTILRQNVLTDTV